MMHSYHKETGKNLTNDAGLNFLHIACARSKLACVKKLLSRKNVDINAQVGRYSGSPYYTALHFAVERGKLDVAMCLLQNDADIYKSDAGGSTPLHLACRRRNIEMIDMLLAHDRYYMNYIDKYSMSHFMAAYMGSYPNLPQRYLSVALNKCNVSSRRLILETADPLIDFFPGYKPLHFAAEWGRVQTVKMLLTYGAFCCARKYSHDPICQILKQHCDNREARMADQSTQVALSQVTPWGSSSSTPEEEALIDKSNSRPLR